jgi:alkylhydroperoxidase family enzyme
MKTKESRFHIHDELTAPEGSLPILKGALSTGGQLSNFLGVLAGSPAVLRAYARFRSEIRHGELPLKSQQRIALAVAQGLGLDEIALARDFDSRDEREHVLLKYVKALVEAPGAAPPMHLHEEAREAGWTDEQILETVAHVSLGLFSTLVTRSGDVPRDGSHEEGRLQQAA